MGLPEAGMCPRLPRHFREQVVASEDQGHEEPTWTSLGDSAPLSCFCHPCLPHPVNMLQKKKVIRQRRASEGWKARRLGRAPMAADPNTGHSASAVLWKTRRRVKAHRRGWRGRWSSQAAEWFPAPGSCCDQEEEDVARAQCFLSDKPAPPQEPWPAYPPAQSPAQGGAG